MCVYGYTYVYLCLKAIRLHLLGVCRFISMMLATHWIQPYVLWLMVAPDSPVCIYVCMYVCVCVRLYVCVVVVSLSVGKP